MRGIKNISFLMLGIFLNMFQVAYANTGISYDMGNLSSSFTKSYDFTPKIDETSRKVSFVLTAPTILKVSYEQMATSGSVVWLEDVNGDVLSRAITSDVLENFGNSTFSLAIPSGNYVIYMDFSGTSHCRLQLEGTPVTLSSFASDLGTFSSTFSLDKTVDLSTPGSTLIGTSSWDGMGCVKMETTRTMNFVLNCRTVGKGNVRFVLLNKEQRVLYDEQKNSIVKCKLDKCPAGVYYILFSANTKVLLQIQGYTLTDAVKLIGSYKRENYTIHRVYTNSMGSSYRDQVTYFDELGREQERVICEASPKAVDDWVLLTEYDAFGRLDKQWLPIAQPDNGGAFVEPMYLKTLVSSFHMGDSKPYSSIYYESSPQSRVLEEYGAGEAWQNKGKSIKEEYLLNKSDNEILSCLHYSALGCAGDMKIQNHGKYPAGNLMVKKVTDEDGNVTYSFTTADGLLVLERKMLAKEALDTYYVYDEWGHIRAILPPLASVELKKNRLSVSEQAGCLSKYAYFYAYDEEYRQTGRKNPGCSWIYTVYDDSDSPVFTQSGEQRDRNEWSFVVSDVWGRPCLQGTCHVPSESNIELAGSVYAVYDGSESLFGYKVYGLQLLNPSMQKVYYYDDYAFMSCKELMLDSYVFDPDLYTNIKENKDVAAAKGKMTGCLLAVDGKIEGSLKRVNYYNERGYLIQQQSSNIRSGKEIYVMAYDFMGNCLSKSQFHSSDGNKTHQLELVSTYDHMGRPLEREIRYDDSCSVKVDSFVYDVLGRTISNKRNNSNLTTTDYAYDIRQRLTGIYGWNFSQRIFYEQSHNGSVPSFNGNVSAVDWSTNNGNVWQGYTYRYDGMARLSDADYWLDGKRVGSYSTSYKYDKMGNVTSVSRMGTLDDGTYGLIDNLSYVYDGNQVSKVTDMVSGPYYKNAMHFVDGVDLQREYEYNKNGAMTKDLNKEILCIEYNLLNLPTRVSFQDGSVISNSYDADGNKLRTSYHVNLASMISSSAGEDTASKFIDYRVDYCDNVEYKADELSCWRFDGGHLEFMEDESPLFFYDLTDYQGNIRTSVTADEDNIAASVNHYYPFGSLMDNSYFGSYSYRYNGKELSLVHGLNWYDYGARMYDGMRFLSLDPHADSYPGISPYAYCLNNPLIFVDKNGMDPGDFFLTVDAAAIDFGLFYNAASIRENREYGSTIYIVYDAQKGVGYSYSVANVGKDNESVFCSSPSSFHVKVADIHTHAAYDKDYYNDDFSGAHNVYGRYLTAEELKQVMNSNDIGWANRKKIISYVVTPSGSLLRYTPQNGCVVMISHGMPCDYNNPHKLNRNFANYIQNSNIKFNNNNFSKY